MKRLRIIGLTVAFSILFFGMVFVSLSWAMWQFTDSGQNLGSSASWYAALGDLDGDGDLDAFVANFYEQPNTVWLNDGSGAFTDRGESLGSSHSFDAALGDLDGDGDLDGFVANFYDQPNTVWLNGGPVPGPPGPFGPSGQSLGSSRSAGVALGDLDGDGDLDAFVANSAQPNTVWLNDGMAYFTDSGQDLGSSDSYGVALGDLDGDGDLDALVANHGTSSGQPNTVWLNDGSGNFTDSGQDLGSLFSLDVALGDLDGDGDLDAFVANYYAGSGQSNTVWLNDGSGTFTDSGQYLGISASSDLALGDVDGDGDLDAFVANFSGEPNRVWLNDGSGTFTDSGQSLGSSDSRGVALGDLDGDGDLDAFVANFYDQPNRVYENVYESMACQCDLNHDGKCDMLDWLLFGEDWGRTDCNEPGPEPCECDLNGDGKCDMLDWLLFGQDWGRTDCAPSLRVWAPRGGESLTAGTRYDITWSGSASITEVDIELSLDSGATYPITVAEATPNDGTYTWGPVPFHDPGKLSSTCKIRIKDSTNPSTIFDESDGVFALAEAASAMTIGQLFEMNDELASDPDGVEQDSDGDGLYDNVELYLGTDPLHWDSDRDGFEDYWETWGDDPEDPILDFDTDGKIAPLDNDDDDDDLNDGRSMDSDGDGIPNYLEIYGFVYTSGPLVYYPWHGDITVDYYKTNPHQSSTDQDQYSDSMEVTKDNMDLTVASPGDNPMIAAFPNFIVKLTDYTVELNSIITETDGTVHTDSSSWQHTIEESTSVTDEWYWEVTREVSCSLTDFGVSVSASYGESHSTTHTRGTATSKGGEMSDAVEWSQATSTNPSEAAKIKLNLRVRNVGTCIAQNIRLTLNLQLGDENIATLTHPPAPDTIPRLLVNDYYDWVSDWVMLTIDELRALRTGVPVTIEVASVSADVVKKVGEEYLVVGDWGTYFAAAESTSAHLFLDLGDGNTTEHVVYAGETDWEPVVTLRDAIIWAANGEEDPVDGPIVRFYQPDGTLGDAAPLEGWYFSLDTDTYANIQSYLQDPGFNLFDTVLKPHTIVVAKAPPMDPTPRIHWAEISPRQGIVKAYVDDYFFSQNLLTVYFVDKNGERHLMTWNEDELYYACTCPTDYFRDGTEKIVARNLMYDPDDPATWKWETELPGSEMVYVPVWENPYFGSFDTPGNAYGVFVLGDYAYVADSFSGLQVIDVSDPANPSLVGTCDTPGWANDVLVLGDYAYVADRASGLQVIDVSNPENPTPVGSCDTLETALGVFVQGGYAYVAYGPSVMPYTPSGIQVIDVSDPENPTPVGSCDTLETALGVFVQGGYAYVGTFSFPTGFLVIDVDPESPKYLTIVGSCDTFGGPVFVQGDYAYVADEEIGLQVIDISNPENPSWVSRLNTSGAYDVFVQGGYAYVAEGSGIQVIDVSNPENPVSVGSHDTLGSAHGVFVSGDYTAYVADGSSGLQVIGF
jgi:hypothetical protein